MEIYAKNVGYKFNKDGSFKEFKGATIVSPLNSDEKIYKVLERVAEDTKDTSYARKYSFLPPVSYHMTNFVLYNDTEIDRNCSGWSSKVPNDISVDDMNDFIYEAIKDVEAPSSYRMKVRAVGPTSLRVVSADEESEKKIRLYRDELAKATGIYWDDHILYIFHITYAYNIIELNGVEKLEQENFLAEQTERVQSEVPEFIIGAPVFCTFNDMGLFSPYIPKEK